MVGSPRRGAGRPASVERRDPRLVPVRNALAVGADGMAVEAENIRAQLRATAVTARPATTSLIHALENGSLEERTEAAAALEELVTCSRETGQSLAMKGACPALIELSKLDNAAAVVAACSAMGTIGTIGANSDIVRESGGIERLMELLAAGSSKAVSLAAVKALSSLLLFSDQNRVVAREGGLIRILLPMLEQPGSKTLHCEVARTLHSLSFDESARVQIAKEGGLTVVIKGLVAGTAEWEVPVAPSSAKSPGREMSGFCLGILSNLTGSTETHRDAADAGAVGAATGIVAATAVYSPDMGAQGLVVLSDLASSSCGRAALLGAPAALKLLLQLLKTMASWSRKESQATLAGKAAHVVFQLACDDADAAKRLAGGGFADPLVAVMQMRPPRDSKSATMNAAVWACVEETLNALVALSGLEEVRGKLLASSGALASLIELLQHDGHYIRAAAHGLIQELSHSNSFGALFKSGVMGVLVSELYEAALSGSMDSCALAAVSAVRNLAFDEACVVAIQEANGVEPLVGILDKAPSVQAKTQAAGALNNFACYPPAVDDMYRAGVIPAVVKLLGIALEMGNTNAGAGGSAEAAGPQGRRGDVLDAMTQCCGLLRNLLADPMGRPDIAVAVAQGGAIAALTPLLEQLPDDVPQALEIVVQAVSALNNLSLDESCCSSIATDPHCLPVLAKLLITARQPRPEGTQQYWDEVTLQVVSLFANLVQHAAWRERVHATGGLRGLVALLAWEAADTRVTAALCSAVASLAGEPKWKEALEKEGALPLLVTVLRHRNENKAVLEVCSAIHNLCANSMHVKAVFGPDVIPELLALLKSKPKPAKEVQRIAGAVLRTLANKHA